MRRRHRIEDYNSLALDVNDTSNPVSVIQVDGEKEPEANQTSHVTCGTANVARHTSHVVHHKSHVTKIFTEGKPV